MADRRVRLQFLGAFAASSGTEDVTAAIAQPKRLALLLWLELSRPRGLHSRDTLCGLLWPESPNEKARAALRQLLLVLRRDLGEDIFVSEGELVGINGERVTSDVGTVLDALEGGDDPRAVAAFGGELLPGLPFAEGDHFERWLEQRRSDLRRAVVQASWREVERAESSGDFAEALRLADWAMSADAADEQGLRRVMTLQAQHGDRTAALRAYRRYADHLRQDWDAEPEEQTRLLNERIKEGDLALAPAARLSTPARVVETPEQASAATTPGTTSQHAADRRRRPLFAAISTTVLVLVAWVVAPRLGTGPSEKDSPVAGEDRSIAVLPFELLAGDSSEAAFILGMHGEIVTQLSRLSSLSVASRVSSSSYRDSRKSPGKIADELGVATLLTGSMQRVGGRVRLQVSLDDAARGRQIWGETYDRELTAENLFAIQGEIAERVAGALRVQLSEGDAAKMSRPATRSLEALNLYHVALLKWDDPLVSRESLMVRALERAVRLDPSFAKAWGLLAQVRSQQLRSGNTFDTLPAWQAAERTRELAPGSVDAFLAAGYYHYWARADFPRALSEFVAAQQALPGSAEIMHATGLLLRRLGRHDEALAAFSRATELDRRDVKGLVHLADTKWFAGRFQDALQEWDRLLELAPTHANAHWGKFLGLSWGLGDTLAAMEHAREARALLDADAAARLDQEVALLRRDWAGAERAARMAARPFQSSHLHWAVAVAMVRRLSGDHAGARRVADSFVRTADLYISASGDDRSPDLFGRRAIALMQAAVARAAGGDTAGAVADGERAIASFNESDDGMDGHFMHRWLALVYTHTGRRSDAIAQLRIAILEPMGVMPNELRFNPLWDPLRGDPQFERLASGRGGS